MNELRGGYGVAVRVAAGQAIKVQNTSGTQVVDTWALNADDLTEYFSVEHTRRLLSRLFLQEGDTLYSNRRTPMLRVEQDHFKGTHDMLCACCDPWLYRHYGQEDHRSCHDNFIEGLGAAGLAAPLVPNPLNLWMNVVISDDNRMTLERPVSRPNDFIVLRALSDVVVVLSACPMDITPVNGGDGTPQAIHYQLLDAKD